MELVLIFAVVDSNAVSKRGRATKRKDTAGLKRRALWKVGLGGAGFALGFAAFYALHVWGVTLRGFLVAFLALPGAYALVGMLELATGTSFGDLSQRWDDLRGWQRGVLGTSVVLAAFVVLFGIMFLSHLLAGAWSAS